MGLNTDILAHKNARKTAKKAWKLANTNCYNKLMYDDSGNADATNFGKVLKEKTNYKTKANEWNSMPNQDWYWIY